MWHRDAVRRLGTLATEHPRYRPKYLVGEGGFGAVYAAEDSRSGREVALKLLHREDPDALHRFRQEYRRVSRVTHPNLVPLVELEQFGDQHFLIMPLLHGAELLPALEATPPEEREAKLRAVLRGVADGLQRLHEEGLLHRDIKPSNIYVTDEGQGILLDFGLAHFMTAPEGKSILGTVAYVSPEQVDHSDRLGPASDWYGLGAVLYDALTGRPPFQGDSPLQVLVDKFQKVPPPVLDLAPQAPPDLAALATGLLAMEPEDRPSVAEIRETLGLPPLAGEAAKETWAHAGVPPVLARRETLDELAREALAPERGAVAWLLGGDPGMGKTTVGEVLRRRVEASPQGVFLHGRCAQGESLPFRGVDGLVDALGDLLRQVPDVDIPTYRPEHLDELLRVFPTLQRVRALSGGPRTLSDKGLSPWEIRRRAAQALGELLHRVAEGRRLTVFLDDLHWIDRDGADFLALVFRETSPTPPAMFVLAFRPSDLSEGQPLSTVFEAVGEREIPLRRRQLGPLPHEDAVRIISHVYPHASPAVRERIAQAAQGNPRYLTEIARDLAHGSGEPLGPPELTPDSAPAAAAADLQAMLARRFRALRPGALEVLGLLALSDTPLPLDVLALAADSGDNPALSTHALRVAHLARGGFGDTPAQVDHEPIREAFARFVEPETARSLHRKLAAALEETGAAAAQIAAHYRGAEDAPREARFTIQAAEEAAQVLAFERAAAFYERAAELYTALDKDAHDLHVRRAQLLVSAQRGPDAARAFLDAARASAPARAPLHRLHAAEQLLVSGHIEEGYALLADVLPSFGMSLESPSYRVLAGVAWQRVVMGLGRLVSTGSQPLRAAEEVPAALLDRIDAKLALGRSLAMLDSTRAAVVNTQAARLALKAQEPRRLRAALLLELSFAAGTGSAKVSYARRQLQALQALHEAWDSPEGPGLEAMAQGFVLALGQGDWAGARPYFAQGRERLRKTPHGLEADVCENFEMVAAATMGDFAWLHGALLDRLDDAERRGDRYQVVSLTCDGSHLSWLARGDDDALLDRVAQVMSGWRREQFLLPRYWELWARTRVALYRPRLTKDLEALHRGWRDISRAGLLYSEAVAVDLLSARGLAALALRARGGLAEAETLGVARKAAARLLKTRHPSGPLRGRLLQAGLLAAQGKPHKARAALDGLDEALGAIHWRLHAAAARLRRGQLLGGDEGEALQGEARRAMRDMGVVAPDAMARVVAPEVVADG